MQAVGGTASHKPGSRQHHRDLAREQAKQSRGHDEHATARSSSSCLNGPAGCVDIDYGKVPSTARRR